MPAPLIDALSGYVYLTKTLKFPASSIIFLGESAGGHLALMLSRYLTELDLPQPGHMALISPWADFTLSFPSYKTMAHYDTLHRGRLRNAVRSAMRWYTPEALKDAYFSPALHGKEAWTYLSDEGTKVWVVYGTRELFVDEDRAMIKAMEAAGVDVTVVEVSDCEGVELMGQDSDGLHTAVVNTDSSKQLYAKELKAFLGIP